MPNSTPHINTDNYISIIIPNYNGEKYLPTLLNALINQTKADNYEIIIIDNNSDDNSIEILNNYKSRLPKLKILSYRKIQSSYAARNYGVSKSTGNILAFTDVDCVPLNNWIESIVKFKGMLENGYLITGKVNLTPKSKQFNIFEIYDSLTSLNQAKYALKNMGATANLIVSKENYYLIGKFKNVISGGDGDFCNRAALKGIKIKYINEIIVLHPARSSFTSLSKKAKRLGKGWSQLLIQNKINLSSRILLIVRTIISVFLQINSFRLISQAFQNKNHRIDGVFKIVKLSVVILIIGTIERISRLIWLMK